MIAILVVMFVAVWVYRRVTREYHNNGDLTEVSAVVSEFSQRMKRLEEGLVDQKVKQEILELRITRRPQTTSVLPPVLDNKEGLVDNLEAGRRLATRKLPASIPKANGERLGGTEHGVLTMVMEGGGRLTAKEIQQKIGKTREHTARMMKSLFKDGLVERDTSMRPYVYAITEKGRNMLGL